MQSFKKSGLSVFVNEKEVNEYVENAYDVLNKKLDTFAADIRKMTSLHEADQYAKETALICVSPLMFKDNKSLTLHYKDGQVALGIYDSISGYLSTKVPFKDILELSLETDSVLQTLERRLENDLKFLEKDLPRTEWHRLTKAWEEHEKQTDVVHHSEPVALNPYMSFYSRNAYIMGKALEYGETLSHITCSENQYQQLLKEMYNKDLLYIPLKTTSGKINICYSECDIDTRQFIENTIGKGIPLEIGEMETKDLIHDLSENTDDIQPEDIEYDDLS